MARRSRIGAELQRGLLEFLRPPSARLEEQLSERVRPRLAAIGHSHAGRPAGEVCAALESVVRAAGGDPDMAALAEFAEQIEAGENPFE
ncbi:hypothetical protein OF117_12910 [Geodermatophilus sp. YIM 151500]|uniref:hypothetical protein n=1 Tax=Geodermatophilus sp. YIM 151500 TaxID=2984531 RepID=UPI0021E3E841|nr:hypothetical protein [Geodermatophilus sp. YIM 151500]MCV2490265.1 hypothetical protein [Geodermatophilus sp. YIM 151500]